MRLKGGERMVTGKDKKGRLNGKDTSGVKSPIIREVTWLGERLPRKDKFVSWFFDDCHPFRQHQLHYAVAHI